VTLEKRYFAQLSQTVTKEKIVTNRTLVEASPLFPFLCFPLCFPPFVSFVYSPFPPFFQLTFS
jgi:hypothetical protein